MARRGLRRSACRQRPPRYALYKAVLDSVHLSEKGDAILLSSKRDVRRIGDGRGELPSH